MDECAICLDVILKSEKKVLECNHVYHTKCIYKWSIKENSCPSCRRFFDFDTNNQKDFLDWMDIKLDNFNQKYRTKDERLNQLIEMINTAIRLEEKKIRCTRLIYKTMLKKLRSYKNEFRPEYSWHSLICNIITFGFYECKNKWYDNTINRLETLSKIVD
jgi:hypothetical protein